MLPVGGVPKWMFACVAEAVIMLSCRMLPSNMLPSNIKMTLMPLDANGFTSNKLGSQSCLKTMAFFDLSVTFCVAQCLEYIFTF